MSNSARGSLRLQLTRLCLAVTALVTALSLVGGLYLALSGAARSWDSNLLNSASIL